MIESRVRAAFLLGLLAGGSMVAFVFRYDISKWIEGRLVRAASCNSWEGRYPEADLVGFLMPLCEDAWYERSQNIQNRWMDYCESGGIDRSTCEEALSTAYGVLHRAAAVRDGE
jgi:hypothetical protein